LSVEGCDDGNTVPEDGCGADCTVEEGFDCGGLSNQGLRCCTSLSEALSTRFSDGRGNGREALTCYNNWWVSPTNSPIVFDGDENLLIDEDINLCGQIQLGEGTGTDGNLDPEETPLRDRTPTWIIATEVHVAGSVEVFATGALWFKGENSLHIEGGCYANLSVAEDQFSVFGTGLVAIEDLYWSHSEDDGAAFDDTPEAFIYVEDCSHIDEGAFFIQSENIPPGSNVFPLIEGDCTSNTAEEGESTFMHLDHIINGHCSNIGTESDNDGTVWVRTNHKDLCAGEIAAMGVVVVGLGAAAAGAAAVTAGGIGSVGAGAADAYVAL
jgi:cysteine-rich repeat protein